MIEIILIDGEIAYYSRAIIRKSFKPAAVFECAQFLIRDGKV
jgi:hypothetical protein